MCDGNASPAGHIHSFPHTPRPFVAPPHAMDWQPAWSDTCPCGRTFTSTHGYTNHQRNCSKTKKRLSSTLAKAREVRDAKKRRIAGVAQLETTSPRVAEEVARAEAPGSSSHLAAAQLPLNDTPLPGTQQQVEFFALKLLPSIIIHFFPLCLSGGRGRSPPISSRTSNAPRESSTSEAVSRYST